jgi:hypothetical protein
MNDPGSAAGKALTGGGSLLPMSEVIRLARHAHHYLAIFDGGKAVGLYHTKRLASSGQRIVIRASRYWNFRAVLGDRGPDESARFVFADVVPVSQKGCLIADRVGPVPEAVAHGFRGTDRRVSGELRTEPILRSGPECVVRTGVGPCDGCCRYDADYQRREERMFHDPMLSASAAAHGRSLRHRRTAAALAATPHGWRIVAPGVPGVACRDGHSLKGDASNMLLVGGADRRKGGSLMNGKVLDVALVAAVAIAFLASANFNPGVGTLMIAFGGMLALGYYNSYVRHDRTKGREGLSGEPPVDPHDTLRAAWR